MRIITNSQQNGQQGNAKLGLKVVEIVLFTEISACPCSINTAMQTVQKPLRRGNLINFKYNIFPPKATTITQTQNF